MMYVVGTASSKSPVADLLERIPEWQAQLSKLHENMDDRQLELLKTPIHHGRIKRNGSCETVRSRDNLEPVAAAEESGGSDVNMVNGTTPIGAGEKVPSKILQNSTSPSPIRNHSNRRAAAAAGISKRETAPALRKRKTESISSIAEGAFRPSLKSKTEKHEIVYDGTVQAAFSDLCVAIAKVRCELRTAKVARERGGGMHGSRAGLLGNRYNIAALSGRSATTTTNGVSNGTDFDADMELEADGLLPDLEAEAPKTNGDLPNLDADMELEVDDNQLPDLEADLDLTPDDAPAKTDNGLPDLTLEADVDLTPDEALPPLSYRSTRLMTSALTSTPYSKALLARHTQPYTAGRYDRYSVGRMSSFGSKKSDEPKDVFDDLDAGLDKASKMSADAAHMFLKLGSCRVEIGKVDGLLKAVRERAERGVREEESLKEDCKPVSPKLPSAGRRYVLGDLTAGLKEKKGGNAGDGGGELEVDDGLGDLGPDNISQPKPTEPTMTETQTDAVAKKQAQFITVIKPDNAMDCSGGLEVDVSSLSMKSADEVVTPLDDIAQQKKLNMENMNSKDIMAKYRAQRIASAKLMAKTMEVHEVHINPLNRVS